MSLRPDPRSFSRLSPYNAKGSQNDYTMIFTVRNISIEQRHISFITRPAGGNQTAIMDTPPSAVIRFRVRTTIKLRLNCMSLAFGPCDEADVSLSTYRPVGQQTSASPV